MRSTASQPHPGRPGYRSNRVRLGVCTLSVALATTTLALGGRALHRRLAGPSCGGNACHFVVARSDPHTQASEVLPEGRALVNFTSEGCPSCRTMDPVFEALRKQCQSVGVRVVRVEVDSPQGEILASRWNVEATPTVVLIDARHEEVGRLVGVSSITKVRAEVQRAFGLVCAPVT